MAAMDNHCIFLLIIFAVSLQLVAADVATTTSPSAKAYWNMKFPGVSMPPILEYMMPKPSGFDYQQGKASFIRDKTMALYNWYSYDVKTSGTQLKNKMFTSMFIREDDLLKPGTIHELQYLGQSDLGPSFMTRDEVQKLPFTSSNLPQILSTFGINTASKEAKLMQSTLTRCEDPLKFGHHTCAPSLEDMVDFVSSEFHPSNPSEDLKVLGVTVTPPMQVNQRYLITGVEKVVEIGNPTIACHKAAFPYGAFMCHRMEGARAYRVELQSLDNNNLKVDTALVGCHHDTDKWSPSYAAFKLLDLKPGQPICHFLLADNLIFIKKVDDIKMVVSSE
ncbi:BURP domain-containing protein 5 [Beta vulgaris subsp. vulgaris]|uniref:BURP domain-containing protein 5 n=1 Tax=Beta vulgaris subsp. vulgaris TaxID=3555 RepID=UPI002036C78A|nr:BURP domain-containing protein 5 [Beta vulgaris subsp. vulgaris]